MHTPVMQRGWMLATTRSSRRNSGQLRPGLVLMRMQNRLPSKWIVSRALTQRDRTQPHTDIFFLQLPCLQRQHRP